MFKLFSGKKESKKEGYFLELKEDEGTAPVIQEVSAPVPEKPKASKQKGKKTKGKETAEVEKVTAVAEEPKYETVSIAEAVSRVKAAPVEEPQKVNFATEYMLTQTFSRRVPGGSLKNFKEMARQIKK